MSYYPDDYSAARARYESDKADAFDSKYEEMYDAFVDDVLEDSHAMFHELDVDHDEVDELSLNLWAIARKVGDKNCLFNPIFEPAVRKYVEALTARELEKCDYL